MPVNLLNALLIQTRSISFVRAIADLAYSGQIAVGIYDNENITTTTDTYTYHKLLNMDITTKLDFFSKNAGGLGYFSGWDDVSDEVCIKKSQFEGKPYQRKEFHYIPTYCKAKTYSVGEKKGLLVHQGYYFYRPEDNTSEPEEKETGQYMYIFTNNNNKITSLGEATEGNKYTTTFTKTIDSMLNPTMGVMVADSWMGKWQTFYKNNSDTKENPSISTGTCDDVTVKTYKANDHWDWDENNVKGEVWNDFEDKWFTHDDSKADVQEKLKEHALNLKNEAMTKIVDASDEVFDKALEAIKASELDEGEKQTAWGIHLLTCKNCNDVLDWRKKLE